MRTEAEIREAIRHLEQAITSPIAARDPHALAATHMLIDAFRWCVGDTSMFERGVMDPCRRADRAERQ